jgi:hypothetical protein
MPYEIKARNGEHIIALNGREIMRLATREEADKLMADFLDEDRPRVIKFRK